MRTLYRYILWTAAVGVAVLAAGIVSIVSTRQQRDAAAPVAATGSEQADLRGPALPHADPEFNASGYALVSGGSGTAVAVDARGRPVVMGRVVREDVPRVALWRFTAAGRLDPDFGGGGSVLAPSTAGTPVAGEYGQGLAMAEDGGIVVAGYSVDGEGRLHLVLWRFTASGRPDPAFHGRGVVSLTGSVGRGADDSAKDLALDPSGRIVVVGSSWPEAGTGRGARESMTVWRFSPSGEPDTGFLGTGRLSVPDARGNAVAVDAAGRILVAGAVYGRAATWIMAVWRFLPDGSADPEWNEGQVLTVRLRDRGWVAPVATAIEAGRDGRVTVMGSVFDRSRLADADDTGLRMVGLWRFNADGTPDRTFGRNGSGLVTMARTAGGEARGAGDNGRDLTVDEQGRTVVAGSSRDAAGRRLLTVWRRTAAGAPDPGLGPAGALVQGDPPAAGDEEPNALVYGVAVDAAGRIVVTGAVRVGNKPYLAVWRMKP